MVSKKPSPQCGIRNHPAAEKKKEEATFKSQDKQASKNHLKGYLILRNSKNNCYMLNIFMSLAVKTADFLMTLNQQVKIRLKCYKPNSYNN